MRNALKRPRREDEEERTGEFQQTARNLEMQTQTQTYHNHSWYAKTLRLRLEFQGWGLFAKTPNSLFSGLRNGSGGSGGGGGGGRTPAWCDGGGSSDGAMARKSVMLTFYAGAMVSALLLFTSSSASHTNVAFQRAVSHRQQRVDDRTRRPVFT